MSDNDFGDLGKGADDLVGIMGIIESLPGRLLKAINAGIFFGSLGSVFFGKRKR